MGTIPAFVITLAVAAVFGLLLDILVNRPLHDAPPLAKLVPSVGVLIALQAAITLRFGGNGQAAPTWSAAGTSTCSVALCGQPIHHRCDRPRAGCGPGLLYRLTRFGLETRAAQENETEAALAGLSPIDSLRSTQCWRPLRPRRWASLPHH